MPQEDRTGPEGRGSLTGRGFGICTEEDIEKVEYIEPIRRERGFGFGRGIGLGRGRGIGLGRGRGIGRGRGWF